MFRIDGAETETAFSHMLRVLSNAESHRGETLVSLDTDGARINLRATEARALAATLNRAADLAEGV